MKITKDSFFAVGSQLKMPQEQMQAFWAGLEEKESSTQSPFAKYLYYLGALIVILAMTWFMTIAWEVFGGGGIFLIATTYAVICTLLGVVLWPKEGLRIPAGLLITIAVCMTPLAIYGLEHYFNVWPADQNISPEHYPEFYQRVEGRWVIMELGTILAGAVALYFFRFPFLTVPIFCATWFLIMDIIPFLFGTKLTWDLSSWIIMVYGLVLVAIGFILDRRKKEDYGFWSYLFGTLSFWAGLNGLVWDKGEFVLFIYLIVNLLMMCLSIILKRTVLMVFGAIGLFAYLSHLAYDLFEHSILFPFALSFIGLAIIYLGILYQRNIKQIEESVLNCLPASLRALLNNKKEDQNQTSQKIKGL